MKPFVDYYREQNISPVSQDLSDLALHMQRRDSLYRALGIPPFLIAGRSIIEFGPGSGHNAVFTASQNPARYVLVDGNPLGLSRTRDLLEEHVSHPSRYELVESLIENFQSEERFDLVLCEGTIPFQIDPKEFARKVSLFVKPGGLLVLTSAGSTSYLSETIRRLISWTLVDRNATVAEKLEAVRPIFSQHLATLKNMSRPADDWILDNITQPFVGDTYSVEDAIASVAAEFDVYGQSPRFVEDWRWYKDTIGDRAYNELATQAYLQNVVNFMDYRILVPPHSAETGARLGVLCDGVFRAMQRYELGKTDSPNDSFEMIDEIASIIRPISEQTAQSLDAALAYLKNPRPSAANSALGPFVSFWGRGQQYLSFIRKQP